MTKKELEVAIENQRLSKHDKIRLANQIGVDVALYQHLWKQVQKGSDRYSRMAVWALEECSINHPFLIEHIIDEVVTFLPHPNHNGIHRSLTKIIAYTNEIEERHQGLLFSLSIDWMLDPQKHVAIKVHCMSIAAKIATYEPDLKDELIMVIEEQVPFNSAGFASRARKVLKLLK